MFSLIEGVHGAQPTFKSIKVDGVTKTSTSGSFTVYTDQDIWVEIKFENNYGSTCIGGITTSLSSFLGSVSSPSFTAAIKNSPYECKIFPVGSRVWNKYGNQITTSKPIIESWESGWYSSPYWEDENQTLKFKINTGSNADTFYIYTRGWLTDDNWNALANNPSSSSYVDQQSYYCFRYTVTVKEPPTPELVADINFLNEPARWGTAVTADLEVENEGDANADNVDVKLVASSDSTYGDSDDHVIKTWSNQDIDAGTTWSKDPHSWTLPSSPYNSYLPEDGTVYYYLWVETASGETDTSDNKDHDSVNMDPRPEPDLIISSLTSPSSGYAGDKIDIVSKTKNAGHLGTGNMTYCYVGYYFEKSPGDKWVYIGRGQTPNIAVEYNGISVGEEEPDEINNWEVPDVSAGTYYITAYADVYDDIDEYESEEGGRKSNTFTVNKKGSAKVTIYPAGASGAEWKLTSGSDTGWKNSGETILNLIPGNYTVEFRFYGDWTKPDNVTLTVPTDGGTGTASGTYRIIANAWWHSDLSVQEGAVVTMKAEVEGFNVNDIFDFEVREADPLGVSYGAPDGNKTGKVYADGGKYYVEASWAAVWWDDNNLGDNPEYFFNVSRGSVTERSPWPLTGYTGLLRVFQRDKSGEIKGILDKPSDFGGVPHEITVKVKNTGRDRNNLIVVPDYPSGWSVSPGDRQTKVDYGETDSTHFTFTVTPPTSADSSDTITWDLFYDEGGITFWDNTWLNDYDMSVSSIPIGNIELTLKNQYGNSVADNNNARFSAYYDGTDREYGNPVTFSDVPVSEGTVWFDGEVMGPLGDWEYWGSVGVQAQAGTKVSDEVVRYAPYAVSFKIYREDDHTEVTGTLEPGTEVYASITVENHDPNNSKDCYVQYLHKVDGQQWSDDTGSDWVAANGGSVTFDTADFTPTTEGDYDCALRVKMKNSLGNYIVSDSWDWATKFRVSLDTPEVTDVKIVDYPEAVDGSFAEMNGGAWNPGKRYMAVVSMEDLDGIEDVQYCTVKLKNSSDETITISYALQGQREPYMWVGDAFVSTADNDYIRIVNEEVSDAGNTRTLKLMFWLTAKWDAGTVTVSAAGEDFNVGGYVSSTKSYSFQPLSLPAGKWTVIVHGKSNSPGNGKPLGTGPWSWSNSMSDWFRRQSEPENDGEWIWEMAYKFRLISAGEIRIHRVKDRASLALQTWIGDEVTGTYSSQYLPTETGHNILLFDWDDPSDFTDLIETEDDWYSYGAADALHALLAREVDVVGSMIGYSRGGIVVSETARRLLRDGYPAMHVVLLDAEGEGGALVRYPDAKFHAWSRTRTDLYRSRSGTEYINWIPGKTLVLGGNALPEADGNDRTVNDWPTYSQSSEVIGHSDYPRYFTEWSYLTTDTQYGQVLVTPQVYRDDNGLQNILYASTLEPSPPPNKDGGIFNGGFDHGSASGWTYHGGTTPFGNIESVEKIDGNYAAQIGNKGLDGDELFHNWLHAPAAARSVRYWVEARSLLPKDSAQLQQDWSGDGYYQTMDYLQLEDVWYDGSVRAYSFNHGDEAGRIAFIANNLRWDTSVYIDDVQFIEGKIPNINTLDGSPNPVVQGTSLNLVAGGVFDSDGSVTEVRFYRDSNGNGSYDSGTDALFGVAYSGSNGDWQITKTTAGIPLGQYWFFARAKDTDDLWSEPQKSAEQITVEEAANQPPVIDALDDEPDTVDRGDDVTLTATGVDDPAGSVVRVEFYHDANNNGVLDIGSGDALLDTDTTIISETASVTVGTGTLPAGTRRFFAVAYDNEGARSAAESCRCSIIQKWELDYDVTPSAGGSITEDPNTGSHPDGTEVDPTASANAGYSFTRWEANGQEVTLPIYLHENTTIIAVFMDNGGGTVSPIINAIGLQTASKGLPFELTVPLLQGDGEITWTLGNAPSGMTMDTNGLISWSDPQAAGGPWFITVTAANAAGSDTKTFMLYMKHVLTVSNGSGGGYYLSGARVSVVAKSIRGKAFVQWQGAVSGVYSASTTLIMPDADTIVTATYNDLPEYTVTVSAETNGVVSPSGEVKVYQGESLSVTADPDGGYKVDHWLVNDEIQSTRKKTLTLENITKPTTIQVLFEKIKAMPWLHLLLE